MTSTRQHAPDSTTVDLVKRYYDSLVPGRRQLLMEFLDPKLVLEIQEGFPATRPRYEGLRQYFDDFLGAVYGVIEVEFAPDEYLGCGDRVVVSGRMRGRAVRSGVPFDVPFVHLWTTNGKTLSRAQFFTDTAKIRDAVDAGEGAGRT